MDTYEFCKRGITFETTCQASSVYKNLISLYSFFIFFICNKYEKSISSSPPEKHTHINYYLMLVQINQNINYYLMLVQINQNI